MGLFFKNSKEGQCQLLPQEVGLWMLPSVQGWLLGPHCFSHLCRDSKPFRKLPLPQLWVCSAPAAAEYSPNPRHQHGVEIQTKLSLSRAHQDSYFYCRKNYGLHFVQQLI